MNIKNNNMCNKNEINKKGVNSTPRVKPKI